MTSSNGHISTRLQRTAELSQKNPERAWNTLAHHIDADFLQEEFRRVRKDLVGAYPRTVKGSHHLPRTKGFELDLPRANCVVTAYLHGEN